MVLFLFRWNWIIAGAAPRMATRYSFCRKPSAFQQTVGLQRLYGVMRTGGRVAAGIGRKGRNKILIPFDNQNKRICKDFFHKPFPSERASELFFKDVFPL